MGLSTSHHYKRYHIWAIHPPACGNTHRGGVKILNMYFWHIPRCLEFLPNIWTYSTTRYLVSCGFPHLLSLEKNFLQKVWKETWTESFVVKMFSIFFGHQGKGIPKIIWIFSNPINHFFAQIVLFSILKQQMLTEENFLNSETLKVLWFEALEIRWKRQRERRQGERTFP